MNPLQAAREIARSFPGGAAALAKRLKRNSTTFSHELCPPAGSLAKLGLATAIAMTEEANDDRILFAWAVSRGYACVKLEVPDRDRPGNLLSDYAAFARKTSKALADVSGAIEDGRITENEIHLCDREISEIAPTAISLLGRLRSAAVQQAKARALPRAKLPIALQEAAVA